MYSMMSCSRLCYSWFRELSCVTLSFVRVTQQSFTNALPARVAPAVVRLSCRSMSCRSRLVVCVLSVLSGYVSGFVTLRHPPSG